MGKTLVLAWGVLGFTIAPIVQSTASAAGKHPEQQANSTLGHRLPHDCVPASSMPAVPLHHFIPLEKHHHAPDSNLEHNSKSCLSHPKYNLNFGVVVYNDYYKIYRSTGLNLRGLREYKKHLDQAGLELPNKIIYLHQGNYKKPDFKGKVKRVVFSAVGKLYGGNFAQQEWELSKHMAEVCPMNAPDRRSACAKTRFKDYFPFKFVHPQGENEDTSVAYVEAKCNPLGGESCKGLKNIPTREETVSALSILLKQILLNDGAVDIHCQGGLHRTGVAALMLRYLQGGVWTKPLAVPFRRPSQMKVDHNGKDSNVKVIATATNLAEKEYYDHNPKDFRQANLDMVREFAKDPFFRCLQKHFSPYLNAEPKQPMPNLSSCFPSTPKPAIPELKPESFSKSARAALWSKCSL